MELHGERQFRGRKDDCFFVLQLGSGLQGEFDDLLVRLFEFNARRLGFADAHRQDVRARQPTDQELTNRKNQTTELRFVLDLTAVGFKTRVLDCVTVRRRLPQFFDGRDASVSELRTCRHGDRLACAAGDYLPHEIANRILNIRPHGTLTENWIVIGL